MIFVSSLLSGFGDFVVCLFMEHFVAYVADCAGADCGLADFRLVGI